MKWIVAGPVVVLLFSSVVVGGQAPPSPKKALTIEALVAPGGLTGRAPENIQWTSDGGRLSYVLRDDGGDHGELWSFDPATGENKVLVSESKLSTLAPDVNKIKNEMEKERITRYSVAAYQWSPDSKHLLFDSLGQLWLYSLETGTAIEFTSAPEPTSDPKFSPDTRQVAYVRKHNLYIRPASGEGERQLTRDKDENLLNGEVDWLYEEELDVRSNYFWSPDSSQIAFLQMDETQVPSYPITDWLALNPTLIQEKYPKPGEPNPSVRLGVVGAKGGGIRWMQMSNERDVYIPRFGWVRDGILWAEVLNRKQDTMDLYFLDARSGHGRKVLTESIPDAWVPVNDNFRVLKSGDRFTWSSWRDGHTHLYLYSFDRQNPLVREAKLEVQLTRGDFEVLALAAVEEPAGVVYFTANKDDPRQEQIYSVKLDGSGLRQVSQEPGVHKADFSPNAKYYVDAYSATLRPPMRAVCAASGADCHQFWQARSVAEYGLLEPKKLELKAEDGAPLLGELVLPENPTGKIPLVVYVYGGPAGQLVRDQWGAGPTDPFYELLAQHGIAVFTVDNRGTPHRGRKFEAAIRHEYGAVELKDQLSSLEQLLDQYPMLDKERVCISGWSNGGSMTLYALLHSTRFHCGISGAPVTDWHLYDSTYTERFLGLPKENPKPYEDSLPAAANHLHGQLLLVHGTSDDNVHIQNTIQMANALINANQQFRLMLYPGKTHGVTGNQRRQLLTMMLDFFEQNLK